MKTLVFFIVFLFSFTFVSLSQDTIWIKGLIHYHVDIHECDDCFIIIKEDSIIKKNLNVVLERFLSGSADRYVAYHPKANVGVFAINFYSKIVKTQFYYGGFPPNGPPVKLEKKIKF